LDNICESFTQMKKGSVFDSQCISVIYVNQSVNLFAQIIESKVDKQDSKTKKH